MHGKTPVVLLMTLFCASLSAQECLDIAPYQGAREVIADLGDIVAPSGVQESYKTRIGGIDQWITVRSRQRCAACCMRSRSA